MKIYPDSVIPKTMRLNLMANNKVFTSSLNGSETTVGFMGDKWVATLNFPSLDNETVLEIDILQSFIWGLQGVIGRFKMWNFTKPGMAAQGSPLVKGSDNSGTLCLTDGWHPYTTVLKSGDFIEFNNELKMVTKDIVSTSIGEATLEFVPPIRNIPSDNEVIVTEKPSGVFRLLDDEQGMFDLISHGEATLQIDLVEAIYVQ